MPVRLLLCTDIATIGLWDSANERHDLRQAKYADYLAALRSDAEAGRLFYIETGGDGSWYVDIYIDDLPDPDLLSAYKLVDRKFLVVSTSEKIIAGGIEEFAGYIEVIKPSPNEILLPKGRYALSLHELDDEKLGEKIVNEIGEDDYRYYEKRWSGVPWGCLTLAIGIVVLALQLWLVGIAVLAFWFVYVAVRWRI